MKTAIFIILMATFLSCNDSGPEPPGAVAPPDSTQIDSLELRKTGK